MTPLESAYSRSCAVNHFLVLAYLLLTATLCITGIFLHNSKLLASAAMVPVLVFLFINSLRHPFLPMLGIAATYMLNIDLNFYGITLNIFLFSICLFSIIYIKMPFRLTSDFRFIFFLLAYVALTFVSYSITNKKLEFYSINIYINNFLILVFMFVFDSSHKIETAYKLIIFCSTMLVISGLYQIFTTGLPETGMTGYWSNHVAYALHIAWGIPLSFYFYINHRSKFYGLIFILLIAGAILAFSRGVLMALGLAAATTPLLSRWPHLSSRKRLIYIATCSLAGITLSLAIASTQHIANQYTADRYERASSGRTVLYHAAWEMFKENPFLGAGWEQFRETWQRHVAVPKTTLDDRGYNTHSSYLKILAELGLVGMTFYLLFNFYLLKSVAKTFITTTGLPLLTALLIYYFHGFVDNNSYGNDRFFYICAGLLYSIRYIDKTKKEADTYHLERGKYLQ